MNIPISFIGILTHEHTARGFGHFSHSFLEMGSNFIVTSSIKCLKNHEKPMVDQNGYLFYKKGTLNHPLHGVLLQSKSYKKYILQAIWYATTWDECR